MIGTYDLFIYLSMPVVAAAIGYLTKFVAVEMMFRPVTFRGIPPYLGWQGVIPRFAPRMAAIAVDSLMARLIDPEELLASRGWCRPATPSSASRPG